MLCENTEPEYIKKMKKSKMMVALLAMVVSGLAHAQERQLKKRCL
jgi:hypothetical protein